MKTVSTFNRQIFASIIFSLALATLLCAQTETKNKTTETTANKPIVILTIDYGDGMQKRFPVVPWKKKMTVADALDWADSHPRGIDKTSKGQGAFQLVTQIDDLKNGAGESKKNWIFRVNDDLADRSCGIFELHAGDRVLWKFEQYK